MIKRIICEDENGNTLFSFDFSGDILIKNYFNCEIADIETENNITIIRLQKIN